MVEDDEGVRAAVVDMLTELGYRVSARRQCRKRAGSCWKARRRDLLFTDVVMPGAISTREFTRRAQEMHPGVHDALHLRLYPERHRPQRQAGRRRASCSPSPIAAFRGATLNDTSILHLRRVSARKGEVAETGARREATA